MSTADENKPDYYKVRAERVVKTNFDDKMHDLKNQEETRLAAMRDDIYLKEREIYDLKNQINLVNLRIGKEGEAKEAAELNLRRTAENFNQESGKMSSTLKSSEKDNEVLRARLATIEKTLHESAMSKNATSSKLEQRSNEMDEATRYYSLESEEQNRRIAILHQELKELQDRVNDTNSKGNLLGNKLKEVTESRERVQYEQEESIDRLKKEYERLSRENEELFNKVSKYTKEVEHSKNSLDKETYDKLQKRNLTEHELSNVSEALKEASVYNNALDLELKSAFRAKYDVEIHVKESRNELEHKIRETSYQLERAATENQSLNSKLDETEQQYRKVFAENEKMLLEFEDTKNFNANANEAKDKEIDHLRSANYQLELNTRSANETITKLDYEINEGTKKFNSMKDSLSTEITSISHKSSNLKSNLDDVYLELKNRQELLSTVKVKTEDLTYRFKNAEAQMAAEANRIHEDNLVKGDELVMARKSCANYGEDVKYTNAQVRELEHKIEDLKRVHENTVTELANMMRRLEESNYAVSTEKDELTRTLGSRSNECRNLSLALADNRNHTLRRETEYNSKIGYDEQQKINDKETMRGLVVDNQQLIKAYDDVIRQKESQHGDIKETRQRVLDLERKLRDTHEAYITRDVHDILSLTDQHSQTRGQYSEQVRSVIEQLRDNLHLVASLDDLKNIEENLGFYKRSLEDGETEIRSRDGRLDKMNKTSHALRTEVDYLNKARADYEAENKKIGDTRAMYDTLWMDNHKLNSENQTLQSTLVKSAAELKETMERRNAYLESSPYRPEVVTYLGSGSGSGRKQASATRWRIQELSDSKRYEGSPRRLKSPSRFDRHSQRNNNY